MGAVWEINGHGLIWNQTTIPWSENEALIKHWPKWYRGSINRPIARTRERIISQWGSERACPAQRGQVCSMSKDLSQGRYIGWAGCKWPYQSGPLALLTVDDRPLDWSPLVTTRPFTWGQKRDFLQDLKW